MKKPTVALTFALAAACSGSSAFADQLLAYSRTMKQIASPQQRRRIYRCALGLLRGAALIAVSFTVGYVPALAQSTTELTLINGWTESPYGTGPATVREVGGMVQFGGAIASGTNPYPFVLPAEFAPATDVYIPVDLCSATKGRLHITPSGTVDIETEGAFSNATCFTSLEGASFAPATAGFTSLTLINGWTNAPFGTSSAAVRNIGGIVYFKGAIASGTNPYPFVLPAAFAPATDVYVTVDLCSATKGRLHITPSGTVDIQTAGAFSNAQCFTSLDGASFAPTTTGFVPPTASITPLTLLNGWTNAPFSTSNAEVIYTDRSVRFKGAIASGTNANPFVLPAALSPTTDVYVPVNLCNATNGRLHIMPSGVVDIETEGAFSNATCFTSLDGAWFVLPVFNLTLNHGWPNAPFSTSLAAARNDVPHFLER